MRLPSSATAGPNQWATDGSMRTTTSALPQTRVTAATTGPKTVVLKLADQSHNILHGKVMALTSACILMDRCDTEQTVYTDHLNTVRFIDDARSKVDQSNRIRKMNGRSYYRWLLELLENRNVTLKYTKSHTGGADKGSKLNGEADLLATEGQNHFDRIPPAPTPTFKLDNFSLHQNQLGWIESNALVAIEQTIAKQTAQDLAFGHRYRLATWLYSSISNPEYPY
jgi:hypothetical protein